MNKKVLFLSILLIVISIFVFVPAEADTGWDTGYGSSDYGSGYDSGYGSGGSYDLGSSHHHSSSVISSSNGSSSTHYDNLTPREKIVRTIMSLAIILFLGWYIVRMFVDLYRDNKKNKVIYNDISIAKGVKYGIVDLFLIK